MEKSSLLFVKAPIRALLFAYSFLQELLALLYFAYQQTRELPFERDEAKSQWLVFKKSSQAVRGHVILIHGYLHDEGCWSHWIEGLLERGMQVYIPRLDHFSRHTLADYTAKVRRLMECDIESDSSFSSLPIHLIGHSMGGMIACDLARQKPDSFASLTSLGAPLHGALFLTKALAFIHPCVTSMIVGHRYACLICEELALSTAYKRFYSAEWDVVVPHPSAWVSELPESNVMVKYCGHGHLVRDRALREEILKKIESLSQNDPGKELD